MERELLEITTTNIANITAFYAAIPPAVLAEFGNQFPTVAGLGAAPSDVALEEMRQRLRQIFENSPMWAASSHFLVDDWRQQLFVPIQPTPIVSVPAQAMALEAAYVLKYPQALGFAFRNPDPEAPNYAINHAAYFQGLSNRFNKPPTLKSTAYINFLRFLEEYKVYANAQGMESLFNCIPVALRTLLRDKLARSYPTFLHGATPIEEVPEDVFLGYTLLCYSASPSVTESAAMEKEFTTLSMTPNPMSFSAEDFENYLGTFKYLKELLQPRMHISEKRWCELLTNGLTGTLLHSTAKKHLKSVTESSTAGFSWFENTLLVTKDSLDNASDVIHAVATRAQAPPKVPVAGKIRANAAITPDSVTASASVPASVAAAITASTKIGANQACWNPRCKAIGQHKVFKCTVNCGISICPEKHLAVATHAAKDCPALRDIEKKSQFILVSSRKPRKRKSSTGHKPSNKSLLMPTGKLRMKISVPIQIDNGSNINLAPASPFGDPIMDASSTDTFINADGRETSIEGIVPIGDSKIMIVENMEQMLVTSNFLDKSNCAQLTWNGVMYLINALSPATLIAILGIVQLLANPIHAVNGLYYLPPNVFESLVDRQTQDSSKSASFSSITLSPNNGAPLNPVCCPAHFRTVKFPTIADMVMFWHVNFNHANMQKMINIVEHKMITNLPTELTVDAIRNHFPHQCISCSLGNLQTLPHPLATTFNETVPIGAHWSCDFKKLSGTDKEKQVLSYAGHTHLFIAIDYRSSRVFHIGTKGTSHADKCIEALYQFVRRKGYMMASLSIDSEFVTKAVTTFLQDPDKNLDYTIRHHNGVNATYTTSANLFVYRQIAIPYEHFTVGEVERFNRTLHEAIMKVYASKPELDERLWELCADDIIDRYNMLPSAKNPTTTPYKQFDNVTMDVLATPIFPFGTTVVAHIPLQRQTVRTGRGFEAIVVGRASEYREGIKLFNVTTKSTVTRRTFKVLGDNPIRGLLFADPINIELTDDDDTTETGPFQLTPSPPRSNLHENPSPLGVLGLSNDPVSTDPVPLQPMLDQNSIDPSTPKLLFKPYNRSKMSSAQRKLFLPLVGKSFVDKEELDTPSFQILDIVAKHGSPKTFYFKYYDSNLPIPTVNEDFEYTPCEELLHSSWADFSNSRAVASAVRRTRTANMPTSYPELVRHPDYDNLFQAFMIEVNSWIDRGALEPNFASVDWNNIDSALIGDLMLLFDIKYHPDGTFDKYKCRMVFRGDRWSNPGVWDKYACAVHIDALMLFLSIVATEDIEL